MKSECISCSIACWGPGWHNQGVTSGLFHGYECGHTLAWTRTIEPSIWAVLSPGADSARPHRGLTLEKEKSGSCQSLTIEKEESRSLGSRTSGPRDFDSSSTSVSRPTCRACRSSFGFWVPLRSFPSMPHRQCDICLFHKLQENSLVPSGV